MLFIQFIPDRRVSPFQKPIAQNDTNIVILYTFSNRQTDRQTEHATRSLAIMQSRATAASTDLDLMSRNTGAAASCWLSIMMSSTRECRKLVMRYEQWTSAG